MLSDWDFYLAPWITDLVPGSAHDAMMIMGVVETRAVVLFAVRPRIGAYGVAVRLVVNLVNLVSLGDFYDVALRDFGLLSGAIALARLASDRTVR